MLLLLLQETREKVKLLLQLADSLVEKGHAHASSIKSWVASVDKRYKDFSSRMEKYRVKLETTLGLSHDVSTVGKSEGEIVGEGGDVRVRVKVWMEV